MDWLNLHSSTLDSPEFIRSDPARRSAWICLLRYCVGQENGGRITNCRHWGDTTWQQLCRVKLKEVNLNCELYWWHNNDLITGFYPIEKEIEVKVNRENGKRGGRPPSKPNGNQVVNHTVSPGLGIAETERKGKERKGKEDKKIGPSDEELDITSSKPLAKLPKTKLGLMDLNSIPGLKVIPKDQQRLLAVLNEVGLDVLSQATRDCLKLAIPAYESNVTPIAYALLAQKSAPPPEKFEDWPEDLNELPDGHPAKRMAKPKAPETNQ